MIKKPPPKTKTKKMKKTLFIVTHGDNYSGLNPGMTASGFEQVRALSPLLPPASEIPVVYIGTGKRHIDMHNVLDLVCLPTRWTASLGGPESLEKIQGQDMVVLANGTTVTRASYTTTDDGVPSMLAVLNRAPNNSVIYSGHPNMIMLRKKNAKPAAVYRISYDNAHLFDLTDLEIQEVKATCDADADDGPGG